MTLVANDGFSSVSYQTPVVLDADHKILYGSIPGMDSDTLSDEAYGYLTQTLPMVTISGNTPSRARTVRHAGLFCTSRFCAMKNMPT